MNRHLWFAVLIAAASATVAFGQAKTPPQARQVDLAKPFKTRSPWKLVVTEGPPVQDYGDGPSPGALRLCLQKDAACTSVGIVPPWAKTKDPDDPDWAAHYVRSAAPVYPYGLKGQPLFQLVTGSLYAGDGDQIVATQLFRYDRPVDRFERVYSHVTATNQNEEVRLILDGPLRGSVISVEPTPNAPFGYWVEVNRPGPAQTYKQVLRFRSATHYGDGNALAVIDSEMPNIQQRLGLWKPGQPLPTPSGGKGCPHPHLKAMELWCE